MVRLGGHYDRGLHLKGLRLSAIARQTGLDRKTIRRYIERGLEPSAYTPRPACVSKIMAFETYLRERVAPYPELTASRLHRELRDLGSAGGYTTVKVFLRAIRPGESARFGMRFETPPVRQAQVGFDHFRAVFTDEPGIDRVVWLFSLVPATAACCGAIRAAAGHADGAALPRHRVRGPGRRTSRNPLRPHEDLSGASPSRSSAASSAPARRSTCCWPRRSPCVRAASTGRLSN